MDIAKLLSVSVTPVVLISASGLIVLALYNRLGLINARVRNFHREKMSLVRELEVDDRIDKRLLLNMMNAQIARVMNKAKLTSLGLSALLSAIVSFVLCSLTAAIGTLVPVVNYVAFGFHLLGLALFLVAILVALFELRHSLEPMQEENEYIDFYCAGITNGQTEKP